MRYNVHIEGRPACGASLSNVRLASITDTAARKKQTTTQNARQISIGGAPVGIIFSAGSKIGWPSTTAAG